MKMYNLTKSEKKLVKHLLDMSKDIEKSLIYVDIKGIHFTFTSVNTHKHNLLLDHNDNINISYDIFKHKILNSNNDLYVKLLSFLRKLSSDYNKKLNNDGNIEEYFKKYENDLSEYEEFKRVKKENERNNDSALYLIEILLDSNNFNKFEVGFDTKVDSLYIKYPEHFKLSYLRNRDIRGQKSLELYKFQKNGKCNQLREILLPK